MTKSDVREAAWQRLHDAGAARFPFPIEGRVPNFAGAERAAERLAGLEVWKRARRIKANPDSAQLPVRRRALAEGKILYMAVPRLAEDPCFLELDPERLPGKELRRAATIKGSSELGRPVSVGDLEGVDLVLAGSVAVRRDGVRVGKGGGYSDLELAIGRELGFVAEDTPIVTTVHPVQITEKAWESEPHDLFVDWIVTPDEAIDTGGGHPRPRGVDFARLDPGMRASIPVLDRLERRG